jgi:hypothetical protein
MADQDPNRDRQDLNVEEPGDTNSGDIVGRTGEQMPVQSHDGLESEEREGSAREDDDGCRRCPSRKTSVSTHK